VADTLSVETGIPVDSAPTKYGIVDQLEPGQSVLFTNINVPSLAACLQYRQVRYGKKFVRRTREGGVRVWRVE
jgi:hypothetical protein